MGQGGVDHRDLLVQAGGFLVCDSSSFKFRVAEFRVVFSGSSSNGSSSSSSCSEGDIIDYIGVIDYIVYIICGSKQGVSELQVGQSQSFESLVS